MSSGAQYEPAIRTAAKAFVANLVEREVEASHAALAFATMGEHGLEEFKAELQSIIDELRGTPAIPARR